MHCFDKITDSAAGGTCAEKQTEVGHFDLSFASSYWYGVCLFNALFPPNGRCSCRCRCRQGIPSWEVGQKDEEVGERILYPTPPFRSIFLPSHLLLMKLVGLWPKAQQVANPTNPVPVRIKSSTSEGEKIKADKNDTEQIGEKSDICRSRDMDRLSGTYVRYLP